MTPTRLLTRGVLLPACAAALCAVASAASATEAVGFDKLSLQVVGHISPSCALGGGGNVDFGDLMRSGLAAKASIAFNCNVPFDLKMSSANGGLANKAMPMGQGPYQGALPYKMSIDVPVLTPTAHKLSASYTSAQLRNGQTLSSGEGVAFDGATIQFDLASPTGAGLLAGQYSETVEITVTPRV